MSTSGTYSFTVTRDDIIYAALRAIGAIDVNNTAESAEVTNAAQELNMILKQWVQEGLPVWTMTTVPVTLSVGVNSYTIGPGGAVNLPYRPPRIISAFLRNTSITPNTDTSVDIIAKVDYERLGSKGSSSIVNQIYYDPQIPLGVIYTYGAPPDTNYTLYVTVQRLLQDMTASTDNFDVPQDFFQALKWSLAEELSYSYDVPLDKVQLIAMKAKKARDEAFAFDQEDTSVFFTVDQRTFNYGRS